MAMPLRMTRAVRMRFTTLMPATTSVPICTTTLVLRHLHLSRHRRICTISTIILFEIWSRQRWQACPLPLGSLLSLRICLLSRSEIRVRRYQIADLLFAAISACGTSFLLAQGITGSRPARIAKVRRDGGRVGSRVKLDPVSSAPLLILVII